MGWAPPSYGLAPHYLRTKRPAKGKQRASVQGKIPELALSLHLTVDTALSVPALTSHSDGL